MIWRQDGDRQCKGLGGPQGRQLPATLVHGLVSVEMFLPAATALATGQSLAGFYLSDGSQRLSLSTWASPQVAW